MASSSPKTLHSITAARGFRAAAAPLVEASELDREGLDALRGRAWQAAHAEWQNRGLGGFRAWCRNEATEGARRLAGPRWRPPAERRGCAIDASCAPEKP